MRSLLAALFISTIAVVGCTDDQSTVGSGFIPEGSRLNVIVDTIKNIDAYTVTQDSILTGNFIAGPIGSMTNPFLGKTTTTLATELYAYYIDTNLFRKENKRVLDSVIIILDVTNNVGLKGKPVSVSLHELTKNLDTLKTYYSNSEISDFNSNAVVSFTLTKKEQKRIALIPGKDLIAERIGNALINTSRDTMVNTGLFRNKFKGFFLRVDPAESGAFYFLNLSSTNSQILVKYHVTTIKDGVEKANEASLPFYFFNKKGFSQRFISIKKDDTTADPILKPTYTVDALNNKTVVYSSSMGGAITLIDLKRLLDWKKDVFKDTAFIISRAELVVEYESSTQTESDRIPSKLGVFTKSSDGNYMPIFDLKLESDKSLVGTYGGLFQKGRMSYSTNITRHLQSVLSKLDVSSKIYLIPLAVGQVPVNENTSFFEDYIYGAFKNTSSSPIKVVITYSKIKK
ncbi:DUF4270 family protein [Williamwhitmania taraxaci]|nr:DUF4270 family protein [Williamwhitmania taraxaci]